MPCSGASGPTSPDHTNNFIMRRDGEANDARQSPALPSAVGASAVNCDCNRNGRTSGAHARAATNMRWNAVRPASYCASLSAGLGAAGPAPSVVAFFSDEQETRAATAIQSIAVLNIVMDFREFVRPRLRRSRTTVMVRLE